MEKLSLAKLVPVPKRLGTADFVDDLSRSAAYNRCDILPLSLCLFLPHPIWGGRKLGRVFHHLIEGTDITGGLACLDPFKSSCFEYRDHDI